MRNQTPFALCIIGGLLLLWVNYSYSLDLFLFIYLFLHSISALSAFFIIIDIILLILVFIAWLGGWAVIIGGALLTTSWVRLGKFIIAIAAGFGMLSFILLVIATVLLLGWSGLLVLTWFTLNTAWFLGLVLTIIARNNATSKR